METSHKRVVFTGGYPILNVKNVPVSLDYYCNTLGFQDVFHWSREDTPPWTFAQVCRGNFFVYLSQEAQGGPGMWMYLDLASLEDLAALYQEYLEKAVKITELPTDKPWGMRVSLADLVKERGRLPHGPDASVHPVHTFFDEFVPDLVSPT